MTVFIAPKAVTALCGPFPAPRAVRAAATIIWRPRQKFIRKAKTRYLRRASDSATVTRPYIPMFSAGRWKYVPVVRAGALSIPTRVRKVASWLSAGTREGFVGWIPWSEGGLGSWV